MYINVLTQIGAKAVDQNYIYSADIYIFSSMMAKFLVSSRILSEGNELHFQAISLIHQLKYSAFFLIFLYFLRFFFQNSL